MRAAFIASAGSCRYPPSLRRGLAQRIGFAGSRSAACALCVRLGCLAVAARHRARRPHGQRFARGADRSRAARRRRRSELPLYQRVLWTARSMARISSCSTTASFAGRPGYEVLTPLMRAGAATLLVDRGWVPFTRLRGRGCRTCASRSASRCASRPGRDSAERGSRGAGARRPHGGPGRRSRLPRRSRSSRRHSASRSSRGSCCSIRRRRRGYVRDWQPPGCRRRGTSRMRSSGGALPPRAPRSGPCWRCAGYAEGAGVRGLLRDRHPSIRGAARPQRAHAWHSRALFLLPLALAFCTLLRHAPGGRGGRINHGELIARARPLPAVASPAARRAGERTRRAPAELLRGQLVARLPRQRRAATRDVPSARSS